MRKQNIGLKTASNRVEKGRSTSINFPPKATEIDSTTKIERKKKEFSAGTR